MALKNRIIRVTIFAATAIVAACASAPPSTIIRTAYDPDPGMEGFRNVLVVGTAGTYQSRAQFERALVAGLSSDRISIAPYFTVLGRNPQLTRTNLDNAIRSRGLDAVIFTRLKGQEKEELAPLRPVGANFDLFGYDYEELNRDLALQQSQAITFVTEIYSTASRRKIWAIESLSFNKETAAELVNEQAAMIAAQIKKDKLLAR